MSTSMSSSGTGCSSARSTGCASACASSGSAQPASRTRELVAAEAGHDAALADRRAAAGRATSWSSRSPCWWPRLSLTSLNPSRSIMITAAPALVPGGDRADARPRSPRAAGTRLGRPVRASWCASWRSWPMSWPFAGRRRRGWRPSRAGARRPASKPRISPSRSPTSSGPMMPASPRSGTTTASRRPWADRYARSCGSRVSRAMSRGAPLRRTTRSSQSPSGPVTASSRSRRPRSARCTRRPGR